MFTRITESGGRRYLQIVESFRNEAGKPRLRVIANLGRVDEMKDGQLDALIRGLSRAAGRTEPGKLEISYGAARSFGDVFALHELWKDLGFDRALGRALRSGKRGIDAEALIRAMVFNRLCEPESKLGRRCWSRARSGRRSGSARRSRAGQWRSGWPQPASTCPRCAAGSAARG